METFGTPANVLDIPLPERPTAFVYQQRHSVGSPVLGVRLTMTVNLQLSGTILQRVVVFFDINF